MIPAFSSLEAYCHPKREDLLNRTIYVDLNLLNEMEIKTPPEPDPELTARVRDALKQLEPFLEQVMRMRFYEGATVAEIAQSLRKSEKEISGALYEAGRQMKIFLAGYVAERWGIEVDGLCKICIHPKRVAIEKILKNKGKNETWRNITENIREATGEKFHPPQVLKAHLKHMNNDEDYDNEKR